MNIHIAALLVGILTFVLAGCIVIGFMALGALIFNEPVIGLFILAGLLVSYCFGLIIVCYLEERA